MMNRRKFLKTMGISIGALQLLPGCTKQARKPNIVFIYADDLDFDQMNVHCYPPEKFPCFTGAHLAGKLPDYYLPENWDPFHFEPESIYTPNMDLLARQGAHFTRFYITSPMCTPSRYSLLTGKYANKSPHLQKDFPTDAQANIEWNQYLSNRENNVVKYLKQAGYFTAIIGKWHNGEPDAANPHSVYQKSKNNPEMLNLKMKEAQRIGCEFLKTDIGFDYAERICFGNADTIGGHNLPWYTEKVLEFLETDHENPFFLYFPLPVPHGMGGGSEFNLDLLQSLEGRLSKIPDSQPSIDDVYRRIRENGCSDRSVSFTWIDDCLGVIMEKLEQRGLAENTILVFASDHQSRGKFSCYEGGRVPFMIRWPGVIKPGTKIEKIYANIDIFPTLLDVAGLPVPKDIDGVSFYEQLTRQQPADSNRALLMETAYTKAVVKGDYKYIANRPPQGVIERMQTEKAKSVADMDRRIGWDGDENTATWNGGVRFSSNQFFTCYFDPDQLYNLRDDVFEQNNLAATETDKLAEMKNELKELLKTCPHTFGEFKSGK